MHGSHFFQLALIVLSSGVAAAQKRVLVIGSTGAGKSTLINALSGYDAMKTSADAKGCTGSYSSVNVVHHGVKYEFIDTVGVNEPDGGKVRKSDAMKLFFKFLKDNKEGFNLIVFCTREARITTEAKATYDIMVKKLYSIKGEAPPVLIVVGGMFFEYESPQDWCRNNRDYFVNQGFSEAGSEGRFLCLSLPGKPKNMVLEKTLSAIRADSTKKAWEAIETVVAPSPIKLWSDWHDFLGLGKVLWNLIARFFGLPLAIPEELEKLLDNLGFTAEEFNEVLDDL